MADPLSALVDSEQLGPRGSIRLVWGAALVTLTPPRA